MNLVGVGNLCFDWVGQYLASCVYVYVHLGVCTGVCSCGVCVITMFVCVCVCVFDNCMFVCVFVYVCMCVCVLLCVFVHDYVCVVHTCGCRDLPSGRYVTPLGSSCVVCTSICETSPSRLFCRIPWRTQSFELCLVCTPVIKYNFSLVSVPLSLVSVT